MSKSSRPICRSGSPPKGHIGRCPKVILTIPLAVFVRLAAKCTAMYRSRFSKNLPIRTQLNDWKAHTGRWRANLLKTKRFMIENKQGSCPKLPTKISLPSFPRIPHRPSSRYIKNSRGGHVMSFLCSTRTLRPWRWIWRSTSKNQFLQVFRIPLGRGSHQESFRYHKWRINWSPYSRLFWGWGFPYINLTYKPIQPI